MARITVSTSGSSGIHDPARYYEGIMSDISGAVDLAIQPENPARCELAHNKATCGGG
jgi:hypothetical protein